MKDEELDSLLDCLSKAKPEAVASGKAGVYLSGFTLLCELFIEKHRPESCWQVNMKYFSFCSGI